MSTRSKQEAQIITSQKIKWTQNITYPVLYNKTIDFEVFDRHKFGYNPEELSQVIRGKFFIGKGESFQDDIEAFSGENSKKVIGKL